MQKFLTRDCKVLNMPKKKEQEKTVFDHITDWFRELKVLGVSGLLVGLGFVLVFI